MTEMELYRRLREVSSSMVQRAQSNDWEGLSTLQALVTKISQQIQLVADPSVLLPEQQREKARLIQGVLEDFENVRARAEPWMEHVRPLLKGLSRPSTTP